MTCSVIILNWNGEAMLRRFLPNVITNTQRTDVEIVVADNGSTDGSLAYLRTEPVRVIELGENFGFAEGYNRAIVQVDSDYVVLLNSDVEVTPHWLDTLLEYARTHEEVVALQPKVLSWYSKQDVLVGKTQKVRFEHAGAAGGMIDCLGYPYCYGRLLTNLEEDNGQYDTPTPIFCHNSYRCSHHPLFWHQRTNPSPPQRSTKIYIYRHKLPRAQSTLHRLSQRLPTHLLSRHNQSYGFHFFY